MGCCGRREKQKEVKAEQKWDYINLSDFKSSTCWTPFSYGILYITIAISITVYALDTFIAINLLAFRRWASAVEPVQIKYTRWIFAGCILLSFLNLGYEWYRAVRVMKRGGVAESYLDPLAVRVQSVRMGKNGRGWRRFLVFAELTKSKKGVEYVALFSYFSFKAWVRILLCEGPRNIINAATLYKVFSASLIPVGQNKPRVGHSAFVQFWVNIGILAQKSRKEALIYSGMAYVLVIWIIAFLNLLIASIMYILFLWHYIPSADNGLSGYLKRKIDGRVNKIVAVKTKKTLKKEVEKMRVQEEKAIKAGARVSQIKRQPTLPILGDFGDEKSEKGFGMSREPTLPSMPPPYSSQPPSRNGTGPNGTGPLSLYSKEPTVPDLAFGAGDKKRLDPPSRAGTNSSIDSNRSQGSNAPLMGHTQGRMDNPYPAGRGGPMNPSNTRSGRPTPPPGGPSFGAFGEMERTMTPVSRMQTPVSRMGAPDGGPAPRQGPPYAGPGFYNGAPRRGTPGPTGRGPPPPQDPRGRRPQTPRGNPNPNQSQNPYGRPPPSGPAPQSGPSPQGGPNARPPPQQRSVTAPIPSNDYASALPSNPYLPAPLNTASSQPSQSFSYPQLPASILRPTLPPTRSTTAPPTSAYSSSRYTTTSRYTTSTAAGGTVYPGYDHEILDAYAGSEASESRQNSVWERDRDRDRPPLPQLPHPAQPRRAATTDDYPPMPPAGGNYI